MRQSEQPPTTAQARYIVLRAFNSDVHHAQGDVIVPGPGWSNLQALIRTRYLVREDEHAAVLQDRAQTERLAGLVGDIVGGGAGRRAEGNVGARVGRS